METSNSSFQKVGSQRDARSTTVVGYDEDARILIEKLKGGRKQLQFISVFGMAGLGKTTLVRKVFTEPLIEYHFHVRAWTTVTQEPKKRDLLLGILKSGFDVDNKNESDMELRATLKRRLSGQRYLVVMDDIWDSKDWNDLMLCFPDDNLGSRIVFTSRLADVPFKVHPGCYKYPLRFLSHEESWNLLRYRVFLEDSCPTSLIKIGQEIARNCKGLPLSLVVMAGILASDQTANWWNQVGEDTSSNVSNAPEQHMKTVELSYKHLPNHLKPCFLYFAAFPEDYEIPYETWMLNRLKHLILRGNIVHQDIPDSQMHCLSNLKTVSTQIPLDQCKKILEYTPNLRKLGIRAALYLSSTKLRIPNLDKLQHLENLSLQNDLNPGYDLTDNLLHRELTSPFMFPATLKKLTLVCTFLKWDEMEQIGMLPNLEVLKLQCEAFRGEKWETTDGGFCRLKHLAFKFIKFVQWSAYSEQFPNLQHLKMDECTQLEEIPIGIGDIYTLERIEIKNCNYAVVQSAHKIIEDQLNKGNDFLKISVFQGMQTSV